MNILKSKLFSFETIYFVIKCEVLVNMAFGLLSTQVLFLDVYGLLWTVRDMAIFGFDKENLRLVIGFITRISCDEEELETFEHLIYNCPALAKLRLRTLGSCSVKDLNCVFENRHQGYPQRWLRSARVSSV